MAELRAQEGVSARALEFAILTAARTGKVIGARWDEVNIAEGLWTIAGERMKAGKEHRMPLSATALAIVEKMAEILSGEFVFPGGEEDRPLSNMAFLMLLRRMGRDSLTVHGFRSSFRDWAAERTGFRSKWPKWRWRMRFPTRSRLPIGAVTYSKNAASSPMPGRSSAPLHRPPERLCRCGRW